MSLVSAMRACVTASAAAFLVNCGGGAGVSPSSPLSNGSPSQQASAQAKTAENPLWGHGCGQWEHKCCKHQGPVEVSPCSVFLDTSKSTAIVTVYGPSGTLIYHDHRCVDKSIASISEGSDWNRGGTRYTITAGSSSGHCRLRFIDKNRDGHGIGRAVLHVFNKA
jgi:hypothetical protein